MLNHISIGVNDTENVARVLARIWNGYAMPFPIASDAWMVMADDGIGTAIEVTPINTVLIPGQGLPDEEDFSMSTPTEEFEARFISGDFSPAYVATHMNINSSLSVDEIKAIGKEQGWRCLVANRGGGIFQLVELWIENRFMVEVMTPEMTERYVELMKPEGWADWLGIELPERGGAAS